MDPRELYKKGDMVKVSQKIVEGKKERVVPFQGQIINIRGIGDNKAITVKQEIDGVDVERIFPIMSPTITSITFVQDKKGARAIAKPSHKKKK